MANDLENVKNILGQIERDARDAYKSASVAEQEEALKIATAEVDRICRFKGHKATATQSLSWPRKGVTDKDGKAVTGVPEALKKAVSFLAAAHLAGYKIGPDNRDHSRALVANLLLILDGLLDPKNPTQDQATLH